MSRVLIAATALVLALGAQTPNKSWADRAEYELAGAAFQESDPKKQVELLRDWVARYPQTDFEHLRQMSLAGVYQKLGDPGKSFRHAAQAFALDAENPDTLMLIAALGPTLPSPSHDQVALVVRSAEKLRTIKLAARPEPPPGSTLQSPINPDTQPVVDYLRTLRAAKDQPASPDPEARKQQVIQAALDWAKNLKR